VCVANFSFCFMKLRLSSFTCPIPHRHMYVMIYNNKMYHWVSEVMDFYLRHFNPVYEVNSENKIVINDIM
jgi:hypothetical protein